ncbi:MULTISPECIES: mannitol dehydrogenase family protein [unclassified Sphingopyxis]|uniref:mannitol dehydrogenase family protein n=1 Tax=unclassified Sphingopyxis TaxID=2614943 RepID=UPI00285953D8|nr:MULTISPECIES: mannitol dehydrogenase family protein [unclassified Sphingopyxis]MDR6833517.1 fructuronate reductase [Sphingopyxis sp. BE122]MDR7225786.1 fructuronate reductase [Sphingopyxis sp. BE259]
MKLNPDTPLPASIQIPAYNRAAQTAGIVHIGIGAFHRAHQAVYTDDAMNAGDRGWGIIGVSLRSGDVAAQLNPQDGLYTVSTRSAAGSKLRLVGAVQRVLVAPEDPQAVIAAIAAPTTHIVSFTVTEKGYLRRPDGSLNLAAASGGTSLYRFVAAGLAARQAAGLPGLTLLSCDNLANNGAVLRGLMREYLAAAHPDLTDWFDRECRFPATMIDRIVPATTDVDRAAVSDLLGARDDGAVVTEDFSQWVIEDDFAGPRPRWETVGGELVADVAPYETAKLRMLNGAHSALAYIGLGRGHEFVHQAIADPAIRPVIERLMRDEAAPTIAAAPGQDLAAYAGALLARFGNPALHHRLLQIAMDGSQKIPQRWLETLAWHQARGQRCASLEMAVAAWVAFLRSDHPIDDPIADQLRDAAAGADALDRLFGPRGLLPSDWTPLGRQQ